MNKEDKLLNKNILYLIPVIFVLIIFFRITYTYNDVKTKEYEFAKKEAEVLNSYVKTHRNYYQKFFIDKIILLNEDTLPALPAFSAAPISKEFSLDNSLDIEVKTVSDRARNPKNMVDSDDLMAVNYFKENKDKDEYFSSNNSEFYQYGYALRIEQKCLACHGVKKDAPKFIQDRYTTAYDYKIGEVRGIISIKIPTNILHEYFIKGFINSVIYDIILFIFLAWFIIYLIKRTNQVNELLELKIKDKTNELNNQNTFLNSYINALDNSTSLSKSDKKGKITYANQKFLDDTGYTLEEVIGKSHNIIRHPDTPTEVFHDMWDTILSNNIWTGIVKGLKKDRTEFITKISIVPVLDHNGKVLEYISPRIDITELVHSKDEILKASITDSITLLKNRRKLLLDIANSNSKDCKLALFNIDRFKNINDFYGHDIADKVLKEIANKLESICLDTSTQVYKLPIDEYAIFNNSSISPDDFIIHINNIIKSIVENKFIINGNNIFLSISCGIATSIDSIMIKADMALQHTKKSKKHITIYSDELDMSAEIINNINGIDILNKAISNNAIIPYFQPIFNLKTKKIEKYESLARIVQEDGKVLTPYHFLDIAIKSKLYPNITKSILIKSFEFFKENKYEFSINLSIEDIINQDTVIFILEQLNNFPDPSRIVFEILESEEIEDYDRLKNFIKDVKKFGCQIAIDDFGSGYSNFAHILELEIDYLKIDASLVKYISTDENSRKITETIINFAKDLNMKTIAEYVEDEKSFNMLDAMGVDYIQGYFIGKPDKELNYEFKI